MFFAVINIWATIFWTFVHILIPIQPSLSSETFASSKYQEKENSRNVGKNFLEFQYSWKRHGNNFSHREKVYYSWKKQQYSFDIHLGFKNIPQVAQFDHGGYM